MAAAASQPPSAARDSPRTTAHVAVRNANSARILTCTCSQSAMPISDAVERSGIYVADIITRALE